MTIYISLKNSTICKVSSDRILRVSRHYLHVAEADVEIFITKRSQTLQQTGSLQTHECWPQRFKAPSPEEFHSHSSRLAPPEFINATTGIFPPVKIQARDWFVGGSLCHPPAKPPLQGTGGINCIDHSDLLDTTAGHERKNFEYSPSSVCPHS